ncbi:SCP2 sterol-binding domain-containing protein [Aspergillus karnatakaensis]|uniref:SCP2 sterol-binding domain-containing protein n=1 Tax=Aspergillus karnatakaensis TaxID=1810916 RepID=UPI003CCCA2BC
MSLKDNDFPSSAAFDVINSTLQGDEAERKDAVKNAQTVVAFTLKNSSGKEQSWYLDLKDKGVVGKGASPPGGKADVTLQLSDADFGSLVSGNANAQKLFMGGKLKIKGNIMKATKMEPVLKKAQGKAKL